MSTHFTLDGLEERIKAHESSFDSLLKLIPAQYYITKELTEEEQNSKYQHNKKRNAPKQEIKERTKKAKKAKLDPENNKSIMDIQSEMAQAGNNSDEEDEDDEEDDEDEDEEEGDVEMKGSDDDVVEDDSEAPVIAKSSTHNFEGLLAQVQTASQTPAQAPKSITELRAKLEERLAKFRGRRGAADPNGAPAKPTSRQAILEARLKRKKDKKASRKLAKEKLAAGSSASEGLVVKEQSTSSSSGGKPSASSINDKGEVRFSKFEFEGLQKKKKGPTDAQGQLKMVEAHKEKLAALQTSDPEKANALKEKDTWKKALQLASGEKVKDDVKLLKKTIKREEVQKKKSSKEWGERKSTISKTKDQKQKKREENIKSRIDAAKNKGKKGDKKGDKKGKGAPKGGKGGKPKARAGFEGKSGKKSSKPSKK